MALGDSMTKRRIAALLAAIVMVSAILPASAFASDPAAGFQVDWTVSGVIRPDGTPRGDDQIAVGDDLHLRFVAVDGTPVTGCTLRLFAIGGEMMDTPGAISTGGCELTVRLPDFPDAEYRSRYPTGDIGLDFCVLPMTMTFADSVTRTLRVLDQLAPAGRSCNDGGDPPSFHAKLDFKVEEGGTPRPFASLPQMLSWNPADWGTAMRPLTFGDTWHYELPDWVAVCSPYINGEWVTVIKGATLPGCEPWNVRVPGVLPSTLPWLGEMGTWGWELISSYQAQPAGPGFTTISAQRTPIASSDLVFASDRLSIFPVDLASTRFVTVGERWTPVYQVTGGIPLTCRMELVTIPPGWPDVGLEFDSFNGTIDPDGRCNFDLDPMAVNEYHQYYIYLTWPAGIDGSGLTFGGSINTIPVPEPPVIDPPVEEPGGDTGIGVDPGAGNGLVVDLEVTPDTGSLVTAAAAGPACEDRAISPNLASGGSIPRLDALCDLAPGDYIATATMIDASGRASTSNRSFTVAVPAPSVASRSPAAYATGVARNIRPSVTFDQPVTGVSGTTVRLRDVNTSAWIPATVTYDPKARRATLSPTALLGADQSYRLYVMAGVKNADGRSAATTSATFRVTADATRPTFTRSPGANATGVSRTANVGLTFSETIRGVSSKKIVVRDALTRAPVAAVVTWTARTIIVNPSVTLSPNRRYTVSILYGLTDLAGNPVAPTSWSFTTKP